MKVKLLCVVAAAMVAACGGGEEGKTAGAKAGKADCPDCDPAGDPAFIQSGVAKRFYQPGDTWRMAWQYVYPVAQAMEALEDEPGQKAARRDLGDVFLFEYLVTDVYSVPVEIGDAVVERQIARIEVQSVVPQGPGAEFMSSEQIDRHEQKFVFELNDQLEPVSETFFDQDHPNGRYVALTGKSRLRTGSSIWPHLVPRVLAGDSGLVFGANMPLQDGELRDVLLAANPQYEQVTYALYRFDTYENEDDVVYWRKGTDPTGQDYHDLWPYYVRTDGGEGVLVGHSW